MGPRCGVRFENKRGPPRGGRKIERGRGAVETLAQELSGRAARPAGKTRTKDMA